MLGGEAMTEQEILDKLNKIVLVDVGWEDRERIMTFNGKPIGATISRRPEIDRWWPSLKRELVQVLAG
jgi:hypothetical protein